MLQNLKEISYSNAIIIDYTIMRVVHLNIHEYYIDTLIYDAIIILFELTDRMFSIDGLEKYQVVIGVFI